jgi:hypothetical protein
MNEPYMKIYANRCELVLSESLHIFYVGNASETVKRRRKKIKEEFANGYLERQICLCKESQVDLSHSKLIEYHSNLLRQLVESVTPKKGRALVAITVLQLCIKDIEPSQSIRLHKTSWKEGISMRSLDKKYITPTLRSHDLLKLNKDGFMMTRGLAESYPYSIVYQAKMQGACKEWLTLVEEIEANKLDSGIALQYLLSQLLNKSNSFKDIAFEIPNTLSNFLKKTKNLNRTYILRLVQKHFSRSNDVARLLEIAMHSLMQAMQGCQVFSDSSLKPLSQMRSANKKHGNVGDIELLENRQIVEAWDAKYGKSYLRDEIEELSEKLEVHSAIRRAGFVTSLEPERLNELEPRCEEIEKLYGISLEILTFTEWVEEQFERTSTEEAASEEELAVAWITAYAESLAQLRRDIAPIDEPCYQWLLTLRGILTEEL